MTRTASSKVRWIMSRDQRIAELAAQAHDRRCGCSGGPHPEDRNAAGRQGWSEEPCGLCGKVVPPWPSLGNGTSAGVRRDRPMSGEGTVAPDPIGDPDAFSDWITARLGSGELIGGISSPEDSSWTRTMMILSRSIDEGFVPGATFVVGEFPRCRVRVESLPHEATTSAALMTMSMHVRRPSLASQGTGKSRDQERPSTVVSASSTAHISSASSWRIRLPSRCTSTAPSCSTSTRVS